MEAEILELLKEIKSNLAISWKDWMPLISTVVGGIIALAGSFGVQFIQTHLSKKKEKHNFLRDKLETIGILSNEFEKALQVDIAQLYGVASPTDTYIAPVHEKIQTLLLNVKLYHDNLSVQADELGACCSNYFNEKREIKIKQMKKDIVQLTDAHTKNINAAFEQCLEAKKRLFERIVKEAEQYKN